AKHVPQMDAQLKWFLRVCLIAPPLSIVLSWLFPSAASFLGILAFVGLPAGTGIIVLGACVIALKAGIPSARLFLVAVACTAVGGVITMFALATEAGLPGWMIYSHHVGIALMGLLLTIGLGFRMRDLRAEQARITSERHQLEIANKHKSEFLAH